MFTGMSFQDPVMRLEEKYTQKQNLVAISGDLVQDRKIDNKYGNSVLYVLSSIKIYANKCTINILAIIIIVC